MQHLYNRIVEKQAIKMEAYVAVHRKMLLLIYTLWKKSEVYNTSIKFLEQPVEAALKIIWLLSQNVWRRQFVKQAE